MLGFHSHLRVQHAGYVGQLSHHWTRKCFRGEAPNWRQLRMTCDDGICWFASYVVICWKLGYIYHGSYYNRYTILQSRSEHGCKMVQHDAKWWKMVQRQLPHTATQPRNTKCSPLYEWPLAAVKSGCPAQLTANKLLLKAHGYDIALHLQKSIQSHRKMRYS